MGDRALKQGQQRKRPSSPLPQDGMRDVKTQRSVSDDIGPGLLNLCRVNSIPNSQNPAREQYCGIEEELSLTADGVKTDELAVRGPIDQKAERANNEEGAGDDVVGNSMPLGPEQITQTIWSQEGSTAAGQKDEIDGGFFETLIQKADKGVSTIANKLMETFQEILPKSSLEENPRNNIHVPHPDKDNAGMIGLGMHIQKVDRGHLMRVLPDGLAHKSKLQDNDVIVAVNECDVTSWAFEELQHFFGSLQEVEIKLLVERKEEKESEDGEPVYNKVTITITLSFEDDKVVVKIDVPDAAWRWRYVGVTESYYIIQDHSNSNTKYLMFKDNSFCMSHASDLTPCKFNLLKYYPNLNGPRVLMNMSQDKPLDISKDTRIGTKGEELYGDGLQILSDKRFFFNMKQEDTKKSTFKLTSQKYHYLVVDADGNLTTQEFSNIKSVDASGRFDLVQTSQVKLQPPS